MDDPRRYLGLRAFGMLRELARKWWQVEIGMTDGAGEVVPGSWEEVPLGGNDFCRVLRSGPPGLRRCHRSLRELATSARRSGGAPSAVGHSCHLGLGMVACAVPAPGPGRALVFACGFSPRELSRTRVGRLRASLGEIAGRRTELAGERVPVLGREDGERLKDLLAFGAIEMAAFDAVRHHAPAIQPLELDGALAGFIARSVPMRELVSRLVAAAGTSAPVLLVGEPGSGKRELARALHSASPRSGGPFETFEGSAEPLAAEARLFGQALPPASPRPGLLEATAGGTIYLAPGSWQTSAIQLRLLRLLHEGELVRLGDDRARPVDVRLVLGLEQPLQQAVTAGLLRPDLAEVLRPGELCVPALRQRAEDLSELVEQQWSRLSADQPAPPLPADTRALLIRYEWPGNLTELEAELRALSTLAGLGLGASADAVSLRIRQSTGGGAQALGELLRGKRVLRDAVALVERELIREGLARTGWNKSQLARELGISRSNLLAKMAHYRLRQPWNRKG